jgi:hypothetical protein
MNRGCNVEHPNPRLTADRCRRCWLYVNVPRYRVAFGGPADTPPDVVAHFFPVRDCARAEGAAVPLKYDGVGWHSEPVPLGEYPGRSVLSLLHEGGWRFGITRAAGGGCESDESSLSSGDSSPLELVFDVKMKRKPEGCCDGTLRVVVLEAV